MIIKKFIDLVDVQTFKVNSNVRPHLDFGEADSNTMKELWDLKKLDYQRVGIILGTNEEIQAIQDLLELLQGRSYDELKQIL